MKTRSQTRRERETTNDILERFPILLCQYVFSHFDHKDLVQASLVSREWNKLAAEKLKLTISCRKQHLLKRKDVNNLFKNSKRKYRNIVLRKLQPEYWRNILRLLEANEGSWKQVNLECCSMLNRQMWFETLQIIEPSVENLLIRGTSSLYPMENDSTWTFPRLKILTCNELSRNPFKCFANCASLVKFCVSTMYDRETNLDVLKVLHNNQNLKELKMWHDEGLLAHDFKFKLEKLQIDAYFGKERVSQNLLNFLQSQAQTLELLDLYFVEINQECLELILNMPRLLSFKNYCRGSSLNWKLAFPVNPSIKHLKCRIIDTDMLHCLARAMPALESIEANHCHVTRFPEQSIFPNIKNFKVENFHDDSQWPTRQLLSAGFATNEVVLRSGCYWLRFK